MAGRRGGTTVGRDAARPEAAGRGQQASRTPPGARNPTGLNRLRVLLAAGMGTVLASYAMFVPAAAVVALTGGAGVSPDGAFATAIPLWLAAHQIPLTLDGRPFGVLPLLPTFLLVLVVAAGAGWALRRLGGRLRTDTGPILATLAGAHAAVAVIGSALLPSAAVVSVAPWSAMLGGGLVAAAGAGLGVLRAGGPLRWPDRVSSWIPTALRAAALALVALASAGALTLTVALVGSAQTVHDAYAELASGFWPALGLTLLTLAYLPNAIVAATAWVLGPGFSVGVAAVSPFAVTAGAPSQFPLLAALPTTAPPVWVLSVLMVPVSVGLLTGVGCRRCVPAERLRATATAVLATALAVALLAVLAGGRLAGGPYDPVRVSPLLLSLVVLVGIGLPALLVVGVPQRLGSADAAAEGAVASGGSPASPAAQRGPRPWTSRRSPKSQISRSGAVPDRSPRPRTVGELVAERARRAQEQARDRGAGDTSDTVESSEAGAGSGAGAGSDAGRGAGPGDGPQAPA